MWNIKKILITVLSFLLLFAISCGNEDTTGGNGGEVSGYTHSNHPPAGEYKYYNHNTNNSPDIIMVTVKIIDGNCNITGKVAPLNGSHLDYDITVKSWYTTPNLPNINRVSTIGGEVIGEATIKTPPPESVEYFQVDYDTANESIIVSVKLLNVDGSYYTHHLTRD